jgi:glycosyltransferase involved in cell wall biosynthesis
MTDTHVFGVTSADFPSKSNTPPTLPEHVWPNKYASLSSHPSQCVEHAVYTLRTQAPGALTLRIALVTDAWFPQVNGVVTTLNNVKVELERDGHELLVINPQLFRTVACPKYSEIRLAMLPGRTLRRMLRDFRPQAIHIATEGPLGLCARHYCGRQRLGFTTSYHTQFAHYLQIYFRVPRSWTFALLRWFHGRAQRTLVPTPTVGRELEARGFRNIVAWTRGVDTDLFKPRGKHLLADPRPISLYVGRVAHEKNIEAFLKLDLPGTKCVIGDGPAMIELVRKYPKARFLGYKHGVELSAHISAADVFVFPSRTDTFGIVMLEAMACGLPVAAFPVTGPIDVVKQNVTGVLNEDLADAAIAATKLDPEACRQYALGFSWRRCAQMFFDNLAPIAHAEQAIRGVSAPLAPAPCAEARRG